MVATSELIANSKLIVRTEFLTIIKHTWNYIIVINFQEIETHFTPN